MRFFDENLFFFIINIYFFQQFHVVERYFAGSSDRAAVFPLDPPSPQRSLMLAYL